MKFYFTLSLLTIFCVKTNAQLTYSITPSSNVSSIVPLNEASEIKIEINNTSNAKLVLNWVRITNTLPVAWQYTTCDNVFCYGGVPSGTKTMDSIAIGGQGFLTLGIDPGNNLGSGQVKIYVYQDGFPNMGDTLTWNVTSQVVGIKEISVNSGISIYPNPINHFLNIELSNQFTQPVLSAYFLDALGRNIKSIQLLNNENRIDVSDLSVGYYYLVIETADEKLFKKLIKSN